MRETRVHPIALAALAGVLAIFISLALGPGPARAAQNRYGNVIFTAPTGWKQVTQPNDILFIAPTTREGVAILSVLQGRVLTGSFSAWFDAAIVGSLSAGQRVIDQTADTAARGDNAYDVLYTLRVVQGPGKAQSYRFFLAAHPGNRVEMIIYFASSKAAFSKYQNVLTAFIASLHFANVPVKPAQQPRSSPQSQSPATRTTGGVTIFFGERSDLTFVPNIAAPGGGSYQYQTRKFTFVFLPANRIYQGLPDATNLVNACAMQDTSHCGTYTRQAQTIQIAWDDGSSQQLVIAADGTSLRLGNVTLNQMTSAPSGLTLHGTYSFTTYVDTSGAGGSGSVSGDHTISFDDSGTFSMSNFVGLVNSGVHSNSSTSSQQTGSGTYHFDGYTVLLTFANGTSQRHVFFIVPNQGTMDVIAIDGVLYLQNG